MTGLPRHIIKKYGVTKKAWRVYRRGRTKKRRVKSMARRRKRTRSYAKKVYRRAKSVFKGTFGQILAGALYGGLRTKFEPQMNNLAGKIPILKNVPLHYRDNAAFGLASYLLAKGHIPFIKKFPIARQIGKTGLMIEAALLGSDIAVKGFGGSITTTNGQTVYG